MFLNTNLKNKFSLLVFLFSALVFSNIWGHNPSHSSTMLVEDEKGGWTLLISSSLTAFQHEIRKKYAEDSYKTPEEFKELVEKHLLESISIFCDDNKEVKLEKLAVKLGHGTKVSFKVIGMPKELKTITVKNLSFENINNSKSALIILKKEIKKEQFVLNKENNHTLELVIKNAEFETVSKTSEKSNYSLWVLLGLALVLILVFLGFRKKIKFLKS